MPQQLRVRKDAAATIESTGAALTALAWLRRYDISSMVPPGATEAVLVRSSGRSLLDITVAFTVIGDALSVARATLNVLIPAAIDAASAAFARTDAVLGNDSAITGSSTSLTGDSSTATHINARLRRVRIDAFTHRGFTVTLTLSSLSGAWVDTLASSPQANEVIALDG